MFFFLRSYSEVLAEAIYLSVDPYMRAFTERIQTGVTMIGGQVAKYMIENDNFIEANEVEHYFFSLK